MSRSYSGTKKTTGYIVHDSDKYVSRSSLGQKKTGVSGRTDAAHLFSYGLMNSIGTHTSGRPMSASLDERHRDMNHPTNMRLKSQYGNRVLDERRDARIAHAFVHGENIHGSTTAARAYQAYQSASTFTTLDSHAAALGNMKVHNPETGRAHLLRNHHKFC